MKIFCFWRVPVFLVAGIYLSHSAEAQFQPTFRIGLNFPFVGVSNAVIADIFTNITPLGVRGIRQLAPGDVTWSGLQPTNTLPLNFTNADQAFFNSAGVLPIGTFYDVSSDTNSTGLQVPWIRGAGFNFSSNELYHASNYIYRVVSRYQGVTHCWEIANEMNTKTNRNIGLPVNEFAAFLVTNRNWIRAADPQAQVVLPGCLGNYGYPITNAHAWLREILTLAGTNGFDVMNYHDYKSWWVLPYDYDGYQSVLAEFNLTNMPVWITECSSASVSNNPNFTVPYASEDQQAADVWRRSCVLFGKGATTWFWHSLYSGPSGGFANCGLLTPGAAGGQKKKSWHSFKLLVEKIEGFQSATALSIDSNQNNNTNGGGGQWAVQFDWSDGTRRYVVWSGTNLNYTLTNLDTNAAPYRITTVVPATLSSDGETATFTITTNALAGTSLALTGTNLPVVVESTLSAFQIWANTRIPNAVLRGQTDDPDGDGQNNYAEFLAGTEPNVASSLFKLTGISPEGSGWRIYWSSATNKNYSVLRATSLTNFSTLQTNLTATPPTNSWLDTNTGNTNRFYRVRLN
jgi:hypothetical protein